MEAVCHRCGSREVTQDYTGTEWDVFWTEMRGAIQDRLMELERRRHSTIIT